MELNTVTNALATQPTQSQLPAKELGRIEEKAKEFEALVLKELLAPMFNSVKSDGLFGGGGEEDVFKSLLQDEYAKAISNRGGVGIADSVKAALIDLQSRP